jgi:IS5 family transposase
MTTCTARGFLFATKNQAKERDPNMHQTKKGKQWYFGMKVHVGTDSKRGLVHSLVTTAANVHDSVMMDELLHGEENVALLKNEWVKMRPYGEYLSNHERRTF